MCACKHRNLKSPTQRGRSRCCDGSTCGRTGFHRKTCSMRRAPSRSGDRTLVPLWSSRTDRTARPRSARFSSEHRDAMSVQRSTEQLLSSRIASSRTPERTETHGEVRGHVFRYFASSCFIINDQIQDLCFQRLDAVTTEAPGINGLKISR